MNAKAAKNKGRRFEVHLEAVFRENIDKNAHRTSGSGAGLDKNDLVIPAYDLEVEAKNCMRYDMDTWWEQMKSQAKKSNRTTVLAIRNPKLPEFQETLIVMDLYDWIELVKWQKEEVEVINNQDPQLKWKIKKLKDAAHEVFKEL